MGERDLSNDGECCIIEKTMRKDNFGYEEIKNLLKHAILPKDLTGDCKKHLSILLRLADFFGSTLKLENYYFLNLKNMNNAYTFKTKVPTEGIA